MVESAPGAHNMLQMCLKRIAVRCGALQCSIVLRSVMQCAVEVCNFMAESLLLGHKYVAAVTQYVAAVTQ